MAMDENLKNPEQEPEKKSVQEPEAAPQQEPKQEPEKKPAEEPAEPEKKADKKADKKAEKKAEKKSKKSGEIDELKEKLAASQDQYLRLIAEYDNFRKRTQKEKDNIYRDARVEIIGKLLPVYDNLERAVANETADEAYKKGVELTMNGLTDILKKMEVESFGEKGDAFDPNIHNAVMHCDDETLGENVIAEVFQKGFRTGDRVIRFAMVKVAN